MNDTSVFGIRKKVPLYILTLIFLSSYNYSQKVVRYELSSLSFVGNNTFSSSTLSDQIQSKETPWWGFKFLNTFSALGAPPAYFDSTILRFDIQALKTFYEVNGFFLVNISTECNIDTSAFTAELLYIITENVPFNYNRVTFHGLDNVSLDLQEIIKANFDIDYSDRYWESEVESKIDEVISTLNDNGYMDASFDSTIIAIDSVKSIANLNIYLNAGSRYQISEIIVEKTGIGKDEVSVNLIRDLTNFENNEYFNFSKIRIGQQRLYRTEIFNTVLVETDAKHKTSGFVPLLVKGDVGYMNELFPELITNDRYGSFNIGLGANYRRKNFLGNARRFGINVQGLIIDMFNFNYSNLFKNRVAQDTTFQGEINASIKLEQPYLFGKTLSASLDSYYESATLKKNSFSTLGIKATLDFEMKPYNFINTLSPYFNLEYSEAIPNLDAINLKLKVFSLTSVLGTEIGSSKTDNLQSPTSGYNLSFIIEGASSETDITLEGLSLYNEIGTNKISVSERAWFYTFQATATTYFALSYDRRLTQAIKFKTGYIQTIKGQYQLIPPNRTFFAGGTSSVRGWRSRELLPKDTIQYFGITEGNTLRGGTFLLEGSFELRNRFVDDFGIVLFADYGNTWNSYKSFKFADLAVAAGIGFRYYTSIVPFRVDFGFKFYDPHQRLFIWNNWDSKYWNNLVFNFGIGESF